MSSVDERIHEALERVGGDVVEPAWESLVVQRRRRRAARAMLGTGAVMLVGTLAVIGIDRVTGSSDGTTHVVTADDPGTGPVAGPTVSVVADGLDVLSVETTPLSEAPDGWLQHTVTLRNDTAETVHIDDFRNWAWLGDEQVLVATEGCGPTGMNPVSGMCLANRQNTTLEPGTEHQYVITLWRDLPGMNALTDGPFEWRLDLSGNGEPGTLVLTYGGLTQPLDRSEPAPAVPVTVRGDGVGPLIVETSPLVPSEHGWVEHTITLTNRSDTTVYVNDPRSSAFLGDRELVVATEGCGYSGGQGGPISAGMCLSYYAPLTIDPGGAAELKITLWRGLVGMNPLGGGSLEWDLPVSTGPTAFSHPDQQGTPGTITITYSGLADLEPAPPEEAGQVPDGRRFALVESLVGGEGGWWLRFQPAEYLSNEEAAQAALDDGATSYLDELPNDFYIRRSDQGPVTLWIDDSVTPLTISESDAPSDWGWDVFVQSYGASPPRGFAPLPIWLTVENGNVVAIEQHYIP